MVCSFNEARLCILFRFLCIIRRSTCYWRPNSLATSVHGQLICNYFYNYHRLVHVNHCCCGSPAIQGQPFNDQWYSLLLNYHYIGPVKTTWLICLFNSIIIVSFSFTLYILSVHRDDKLLKILKLKKWLLVSLSSFWACRRKFSFQRAFFLNYCFKSIWKSQAKAAIPTFPRNSSEALT